MLTAVRSRVGIDRHPTDWVDHGLVCNGHRRAAAISIRKFPLVPVVGYVGGLLIYKHEAHPFNGAGSNVVTRVVYCSYEA